MQAMPGRKWVFTNADRKHAQTCLRLLGIEDCFEVGFRASGASLCHTRRGSSLSISWLAYFQQIILRILAIRLYYVLA